MKSSLLLMALLGFVLGMIVNHLVEHLRIFHAQQRTARQLRDIVVTEDEAPERPLGE